MSNTPIKRKMTRGERAIHWCESHLRVPEGRFVGQKLKLANFQKKIILQIYDNPHPDGTRRAICSMPRKAAKTTLASCLVLLHLCGPEHVRNGQLYSAARSRDQAGILFKTAVKMVLMNPNLKRDISINMTQKKLSCVALGTVYQALSKEASTALGLSPVMVVHDELGAVKGPSDELYDALESASAAQERPLSIIISTQARDDTALLSQLIEDAKKGLDPTTTLTLYECPKDVDAFTVEALAKAHPAWDEFVNKAELIRLMEEAKRMRSKEPSYRNFILNQRIDYNEPFIAKSLWDACAGEPLPLDGRDIYLGVDLSKTNDLTAVVAVFQCDDGLVHVHPFFWTAEGGFAEKDSKARGAYSIWRDDGFINVVPGPVIDYDFVAAKIIELSKRANIKKIAYDAYKWDDMLMAFIRKDIPEYWIEETCTKFVQKAWRFAPAVTNLENHFLKHEIRHGMNPLLGYCFDNVKLFRDSSDNRKFDKITPDRKIDGAVALAQAVQIMHESTTETGSRSYLETDEPLIW